MHNLFMLTSILKQTVRQDYYNMPGVYNPFAAASGTSLKLTIVNSVATTLDINSAHNWQE